MENPKISLIICAYNEEKYIGDCLDYAIKNSAGKFFEIIVVDNRSTDRTKEVALKRNSVKVVREENKGLTYARQRGFLTATGDILAYIDADTRMPLCWYEKIVSEFNKNPNLACLSGPALYHDIPVWQKILVWCYWYIIAFPMYFLVGYMVMGANFVIKKEILQKMNGFDTSIKFYGEDTNLARRASKFGKVKFSTNFVIYFSGRRMSGQGLWYTGFEYVKNFLSEVFLHHPATTNYKDFR